MKIRRIMQMMKQGKCVTFFQRDAGDRGPQWVTDGAAAYCLEGLPKIRTAEEFFNAYDVREKERDKYLVRFETLPDFIRDLERWTGGVTARAGRLAIQSEATTFRAFFAEQEDTALLVKEKYLSPFEGEDDDYTEYSIRQGKDGGRSLCVFDGMEPRAVIMPLEHSADGGDELREELNAISWAVYQTMSRTESVRQPAQDGGEEQA